MLLSSRVNKSVLPSDETSRPGMTAGGGACDRRMIGVFWGSGYAHLGIPGQTGNHKFYAFSK